MKLCAVMLCVSGDGLAEEPLRENVPTASQELSALAVKKVMPLGDSITQGASGRASYRCALWQKIQAGGSSADFVGSVTGGHGGANSCSVSGFDVQHEGHWGWRADQILAQLSTWAAHTRPDIALIHLGSNDMFQGNTVDSTIQELSQIIDRLRAANPHIQIFLAQLIPATNSSAIQGFNQRIPGLASSKSTSASPVTVVDQWTGFNAQTDTYDGIHPNPTGEAKMAERWYQALRSSL
ncbi:SGNH/GDSL hydrolase family protein [Stigmatella sp. ncwal1]|uniref:SGNH/GDSL hydrolase family protein n=1 Tax=Stigmatella ashevillensis TaxID=2995309 RepID=A0ABT5DR80_9BACT|nr:SGNH/GDSL hydrolase family protein [Stigmatella ashevillena]MDC0714902.1 SGNH/GDSL hydrolase family protein [Stigmatella ashevillena]